MSVRNWIIGIAAVAVLGYGVQFVFKRAENQSHAVTSGYIVGIRTYTNFWDKDTVHYDVTIRGEKFVTMEREKTMDYTLYDVGEEIYEMVLHGSREDRFTISYNGEEILVWYEEGVDVTIE